MRGRISAKIALLITLAAMQSLAQQLLQGIPITFEFAGDVLYTPTSGGVNIPGYKLRVGFSKYKWIGLKFMSLTSQSTYDILIVKRQSEPVGGYYETNVDDYFVSSGRQNKLISDSVNNMDKDVTTYSDDNYFYAEIFRTKGNTQGEDWQGGQFVQICFLTSSGKFNQNKWSGLSSSCYGYDITADYYSTMRGKKLQSMKVDRTSAITYGGIDGPVLEVKLFWYVKSPTLSSSDVYIRIGDKFEEERLGYDYHKCGEGDYFGTSTSNLTPDTLWSGYNDGECTVVSSATSTKIAYSRRVYTGDQFDSLIYEKTEICIIVGSRSSCKQLQFDILFPVMTVNSAFAIFENKIKWQILAMISVLLLVHIL